MGSASQDTGQTPTGGAEAGEVCIAEHQPERAACAPE